MASHAKQIAPVSDSVAPPELERIRDAVIRLGALGLRDQVLREFWSVGDWEGLSGIVQARPTETDTEACLCSVQSAALLNQAPLQLMFALFSSKLPEFRQRRMLNIATAATALTLAVEFQKESRVSGMLHLIDLATGLLDQELPPQSRVELYQPLLELYSVLLEEETSRADIHGNQYAWVLDARREQVVQRLHQASRPATPEFPVEVALKGPDKELPRRDYQYADFFAKDEMPDLDYRAEYLARTNYSRLLLAMVGLIALSVIVVVSFVYQDEISWRLHEFASSGSSRTLAAIEELSDRRKQESNDSIFSTHSASSSEAAPSSVTGRSDPALAGSPRVQAREILEQQRELKGEVSDPEKTSGLLATSEISKLIWMRRSPSFQGRPISHLESGTKVQLWNRKDGWGEVTTGDIRGWVPLFSIKGERVPKRSTAAGKPKQKDAPRKIQHKRWNWLDL